MHAGLEALPGLGQGLCQGGPCPEALVPYPCLVVGVPCHGLLCHDLQAGHALSLPILTPLMQNEVIDGMD